MAEDNQLINAIYAIISVEENIERLHVYEKKIGEGSVVIPLIATHEDNLAWLLKAAKGLAELAKDTDKQIKLIKMTVREELEI